MTHSFNFGKVAVMFGGASAEREVSLNSGKAVLAALRNQGIDAIEFDPSVRPLTDLVLLKVDRVFIALHGRGGEDGSMQGALQSLSIPYTGSKVLGSALAMDKIRCKWLWSQLGLPTAEYHVVDATQPFDITMAEQYIKEFQGQAMVKPALEGSSVGMTKANSATDLVEGVEHAFEFDEHILIERYIEGNEYTVSMLNGRALPSIRMTTPRDFYDYTAKYHAEGSTQYFCPSGLSAEAEQQIAQIATRAFAAVDGFGWGRIDFMQDLEGQFYLLEANTVPGMTASSLVPMAASAAGLTFESLCIEILKTSL